MAIDFEAVKRKLAGLSQGNRNSTVWKPKEGENTIRLVPLKGEQVPFLERHFYYFLPVPGGVIAPFATWGKSDPIAELKNKLYQEGSDESKTLAKGLFPKLRIYAPMVDREDEEAGVRWYGFGRRVYETLLGLILNEDYGDITDVKTGHDLRITFKKGDPTSNTWPETKIVARPKPSRLHKDDSAIDKWLDNVPDVDVEFNVKSYDELTSLLNEWLSDSNSSDSNDDDSSSNKESESKIDNAFAELMNDDE